MKPRRGIARFARSMRNALRLLAIALIATGLTPEARADKITKYVLSDVTAVNDGVTATVTGYFDYDFTTGFESAVDFTWNASGLSSPYPDLNGSYTEVINPPTDFNSAEGGNASNFNVTIFFGPQAFGPYTDPVTQVLASLPGTYCNQVAPCELDSTVVTGYAIPTIPEPSDAAMLVTALVGLGWMRRAIRAS